VLGVDGTLVELKVTNPTFVALGEFAPATVVGIANGVEVLIACVESPPYVAETNAVPGGSTLVVAVAVPVVSGKGPNDPRTVV
jgi:hypothetical protein